MTTCLNFSNFTGGNLYPFLPSRMPEDSQVIVFFHGFMGRASSFRSLFEFLPESYYLIGIDLPGHGKSLFHQRECLKKLQSFSDVAELVLTDLSRGGIERFSMYGYSMGGRIAQQAALVAPDRIDCLIMESSGFGISDPDARNERYENDLRMLSGIGCDAEFEAFLDRWHDMDLFCTLKPEEKYRLKEEKRNNDIAELRRAISILSVGKQPYLLTSLAQSPFPVALFFGKKDARYMAVASEAAKCLPNARFRFFSGASHDIHTQLPQEVALEMVDLLNTVYSNSFFKGGSTGNSHIDGI